MKRLEMKKQLYEILNNYLGQQVVIRVVFIAYGALKSPTARHNRAKIAAYIENTRHSYIDFSSAFCYNIYVRKYRRMRSWKNWIREGLLNMKKNLALIREDGGSVYPMNGIQVDKGFYTVFELKRRFDASEKRIILDSDFQREDVWGNNRKAELIESVLMGLPLPVFYFNQDKYGRLIVIDGRQRLTALFEFMDDNYKLRNLKILREQNGCFFSQLSPVLQARIEDYQIQAHVIMPPTPDRIKFDIFDRVNRGGMKLNKQEIRNALYQGNATRFLKSIVKSEAFFRATGKAFKNEKRMKDKYLVTRFLAIYMYQEHFFKNADGSIYEYKEDMDDLLGRTMDLMNILNEEKLKELYKMVEETLDKSFFYLGEDAFRFKNNSSRKTPINMNVFETVMYIMTFVPKKYEEDRPRIQKCIYALLDSPEFKENIRSHRDGYAQWIWRVEAAKKVGRELKDDTENPN